MALPDNARPRSVGKLDLPDLALGDAARMRPDRSRPHAWSSPPNATSAAGSCRVISSAATPTPRRWLWNHLGFDRAAMQERSEGSVVVEMLNHYRRPLRAGDLWW